MTTLIDLTLEGQARTRERIIILERMAQEFTAEGDDVAADKTENLIAHIESGDLFHATNHS